MTKYRVQFNELLSGGRVIDHDEVITGTVDNVQDRLDDFSWDADSLVVIEFVGSDAAGTPVDTAIFN